MVDGKSKQVLEHRHIVEQIIGRKLDRNEHIHHRDEDGINNEPTNLEIMSPREHQRHHLMGTRKWPVDEGAQLRSEGWTLYEIADHYGVSQRAVLNAFKVRGICTKKIRPSTPISWDIEEAKTLRATGMTWNAIGCKFGVSGTAIRVALARRAL